ncbi:histone-lysine N-methyltransferase SETD2 [Neosynchiropus ocellatus]
MLSNHLMFKGTKMKVNLEDQGRQKVSFSFAQTKKPLQSVFIIPTNPEKPAAEAPSSVTTSDRERENAELKLPHAASSSLAEAHPRKAVSSAAKLKTNVGKLHSKIDLLVSEQSTSDVGVAAFSYKTTSEASPPESSEIGRGVDPKNLTPSSGKAAERSNKEPENVCKKDIKYQPDRAAPGSDSDNDSLQTPSCRKSSDLKSKTSLDCSGRTAKKSSSGSYVDERERSSSKRPDNYERSSSHSRSDRDSRHASSRSSRSEKDRWRSRSRSRSRSRGSRTGSSHSRSDRCRGDRGSRSDRSYYHDSDRRSYRSPPRRDRRRSRSRNDRTRDSSDSEEDHRKTRTRTGDSVRTSTYSSSHKESKSSSYSKSEKPSKAVDSPYSSGSDRRTYSSRSERSSKRLSDSDSKQRPSPHRDLSYQKASSYHKSETNSKTSSSHHTSSRPQKSNSTDSDANHRRTPHTAEKCSSPAEVSTNLEHRPTQASPTGAKNASLDRRSSDSNVSPIKMPKPSLHGLVAESESQTNESPRGDPGGPGGLENKPCAVTVLQDSPSVEQVRSIESVSDLKSTSHGDVTPLGAEDQTKQEEPLKSDSCSRKDAELHKQNKSEAGCSSGRRDGGAIGVTNVALEEGGKQNVGDVDTPLLILNHVEGSPPGADSSCRGFESLPTRDGGLARKSRWDIIGQNDCPPATEHTSKEGEVFTDDSSLVSASQETIHSKTAERSDGSTAPAYTGDNIQRDLLEVNTTADHCAALLGLPRRTNLHDPVLTEERAVPCSTADDASQESALCSRMPSHHGPLGARSEASDSDNSEYDSDCGEEIKRLHSVVVVPQNSSLTGSQDAGAPPCVPLGGALDQVGSLHEVDSSKASTPCQSQSNMIDSTSHSENIGSYLAVNTGAHVVLAEPAAVENREHTSRLYTYYHTTSGGDGLACHGGSALGSDLSQLELPSSTYQQPDSSHGLPVQSFKPSETSYHGQELHDVSWNQQLPSVPTCVIKSYSHAKERFPDPAGEVHPDSLTNDHEDYKSSTTAPAAEYAAANSSESSCFVQGHEISSNSRGSSIPDPPRDDSFRQHRSRGPPKKRRPEIESDSDNEAEAGPAGKRERLGQSTDAKEPQAKPEVRWPTLNLLDFQDSGKWKDLARSKKMPPYFDLIEENLYLTERKKSKSHRDIKRMQCECSVLSREERSRGVLACGEDCLNRLLMIECSSRCLNGAYCSNRRFQMKQHADFEVILTQDKGWGLRAAKDLPPNTFVLEYCGEVLDHKEFKARVKEYARNKNIHYYFMALKNNEIIDATLKGNCSRFMNHSCEPNCETQKWTVNGQVRVGFFTTKAVAAGTELTFDYQFQRYGKEAQKCFCGAPSCRGFLGGENRVSVRAAGGRMKKDRSRKSALTTVDEELEALLENGEGLFDEKQVVSLCRLMVRVETMEQKLLCLKLIQDTRNPSCLKQFLDHHGLSLLWIFMVEITEAKGNNSGNIKLQLEIMKTLHVLPIPTKNMLEESRVLTFIQRWAQTKALPQAVEMDGYSSENTSRAQTPLNTPDGSASKLGPELDGDATKPAVYRRLKIISENSLDSALSDASKASDGKDEDEEADDEDGDESSNGGLSDAKQLKEGAAMEAEESQKEEPPKEAETGSSSPEHSSDEANNKTDLEKSDGQTNEPSDERTSDQPPVPAIESSPAADPERRPATASMSDDQPPSESLRPETASPHVDVVEGLPDQTSDYSPAETLSSELPSVSESAVETPLILESVASAAPLEVAAPLSEQPAIGTPSQDEEEGVSDVESERSQEPQVSTLDISGMAAKLLDVWKDLKEVYRIPKKSQIDKDTNGNGSLRIVLPCFLAHQCVVTDRSRDRDVSTSRTTSGSRERERERDRDYDRDWDRERERVADKTPRSSERRRRRSSSPPSSYERSSRRAEERFDPSKTPRGVASKERNKLSTEERRKLFEQEVAQREAQKQQQQQQQQQLQTMVYDPALAYAPSPSFINYPPGYPLQTYVEPSNPNTGKVLLPTPPVEASLTSEQPPPQHLNSNGGLPSLSSAPQATPVSDIPQHLTPTSHTSGTPQQDPGVAVLSVPAQAAPQVQSQQSYATIWDPTTQQAVTVQTQPPQQYAAPPPQAPPQTAIYYQGQPCQTIYSLPAPYPQPSAPVIQAYAEPTANYLHGQPVYPGHQQGVVVQQGGTVTTIVTSQTVQQEMIVANNVIDLPPPSPPKPKTIVLPPNWKVARDPEGKIYYYHIVTRQTQWDPPTWEASGDNTSVDHESEMDLGTPTYDENPSKFSTKTAEADTSSELAKKSKETFRKEMSQFIVQCLNPYRKPDCKLGRISNTEDFKHLARKLTHGVMNKELKACNNPEDLECNENVKHKTKEYIKKYMQRFGTVYKPKDDTEVY